MVRRTPVWQVIASFRQRGLCLFGHNCRKSAPNSAEIQFREGGTLIAYLECMLADSLDCSCDTFSATVAPHRSMLFGLAYRLTKRREDADDLLQDTMLRGYRAWGRFERGSNCRAWLARIMTNCFVSGYRRRRRHERFVANTYEQETSCPTQPDDPRKRLDSGLGDEVTSALGTLTPIHREVVELADVHGVQYREIARELDVPIGTVMSRLFRARRQLEEQLHDYARNDYGMCRAA